MMILRLTKKIDFVMEKLNKYLKESFGDSLNSQIRALKTELMNRQRLGFFDEWFSQKSNLEKDVSPLNKDLRIWKNTDLSSLVLHKLINTGKLEWNDQSEITTIGSNSSLVRNMDGTAIIIYDFFKNVDENSPGLDFEYPIERLLRDKHVPCKFRNDSGLVCTELPMKTNLIGTPLERFMGQPYLDNTCTAFWVGNNRLVTAAHCYKKRCTGGSSAERSFEHAAVVFGFDDLPQLFDGKTLKIPKSNVHRVEKVDGQYGCDELADWIIFILKTDPNLTPLPIFRGQIPGKGTPLYQLGHPLGLPMKYNFQGEVGETHLNFLYTDLDSFLGNSGSPVFLAKGEHKGQVVGITIRGECDFITDDGKTALPLICNAGPDGCFGEVVQFVGPFQDRIPPPIIDFNPHQYNELLRF
jgi:hypothetical protein